LPGTHEAHDADPVDLERRLSLVRRDDAGNEDVVAHLPEEGGLAKDACVVAHAVSDEDEGRGHR
jgi:hypothetical protein